MPRRNLNLILFFLAFSLVCYVRSSGEVSDVVGEVCREVRANYVEPIDNQKLINGALSGITDKLDRYSSYLPAEQFQTFSESTEQTFAGIGVLVSFQPDKQQLIIESPLPDSPAQRAGLRRGDVILEVDGHSTEGFNMNDLKTALRGPEGTEVEMTVLHRHNSKPTKVVVQRAMIETETVMGVNRQADGSWNYILDPDERIGYVQIESFGRNTKRELANALAWLMTQDVRGLVIDVRDNPGGLLDVVVEVCELFIEDGVVVTTKGRGGDLRKSFTARNPNAIRKRDLPIAILVNGLSASASEIFAACLQDHQRAVVVGERTWGKGSVQNVIPLNSKLGALKLTVAHFYRPSDKNIHKKDDARPEDDWGVRPDPGYEVKLSLEELKEVRKHQQESRLMPLDDKPLKPVEDRQLEKALDYLRRELHPQQREAAFESHEAVEPF